MPPASTTPSLSFASLATAPHAVPAPHLVPTTTTPLVPDTTIVHTAPPAFTTPTAPTVPTTWHTAPAPSHASTTPPTPLQSSPYPPRTLHSPPLAATSTVPPDEPRHPAVKAAPKLRSEKKPDKLRRSTPKATPASLPATPPEPTTAPSPPISPELAALGSTTQQLAESVRLIQAQQQMILDSQRAQEQRQQLLHQDLPTTGPTLPTPSPTSALPTPMPPPAPKARPIEPEAPDPQHCFDSASSHSSPSTTNIAITPTTIQDSKITLPSTIYTFLITDHLPLTVRIDLVLPFLDIAPRPNMTKIAEHLPLTDDDHHPDDAHQQLIDVIDLILHLAPELLVAIPEAVKSYYDQPHVRPIQASFPHLMLMTLGAIGTTATILHDHHRGTARPRSPVGPPPPDPPSNPPADTTAPLGAVAFRVPDGDSENSDAAEAFSISQFDKNDIELSELVEAANDPQRVRCLTELDPDYTVPLRTTLNQPNKLLFNNFVDEMFNQLAQPHRTTNNELIFIKASQATVMNIAKAFAQSRLLDIDLAKRTRAFYVEPENLLTITVPTGLPKKPIYRGEHAGTYLIYHKTSWESVAKILAEDCIRPATWTKNEAGYPTQYPCYGFFGMSSEIR